MTDHDLYDVLGLNADCSFDEIKVAYRKMARKFHPDLNPSAEAAERIKIINIAYDILSDPAKREKYDFMRKYGAYSNVYSANYGESVEFTSLSEFFEFLSGLPPEELEKIREQLFNQLFNNFVIGLREFGERITRNIRNNIRNSFINAEKTAQTIFDLLTFGLFKRRSR
jgi:DnaJ-class molecular chaperone